MVKFPKVDKESIAMQCVGFIVYSAIQFCLYLFGPVARIEKLAQHDSCLPIAVDVNER